MDGQGSRRSGGAARVLGSGGFRTRFWWPAVLLLGALTYLHLLDGLSIPRIGDEAPYIQIVRLTAESGQWLPLKTPPGLENTKPPLLFWSGIVSTDWAREWTLFRLRFPVLLSTFMTAAVVFVVGARVAGNREGGYLSALSYLGFTSTFQYGRPFLTNLPETLFVFLPYSLVAFFRHRLERWGTGLWVLVGLLLGLACLFKSFVLVAPAGVALAWLRLAERGGSLRAFLRKDAPRLALALALALVCFSLWPALDPEPRAVLGDFVLEENVGKVVRGDYWTGLWRGPYPLVRIWLGPLANAGWFALPLLVLLVEAVSRRERLSDEEKALWILVVSFLLVYSLPAQRQENYVLPVAPAMAVVLGVRWQGIGRRWFTLFQIPILLALVLTLRLMLEIAERALPPHGYSVGQWALPASALGICGWSFVRSRVAPYTYHLQSLLALASFTCLLAPFDGPPGRFDPERAALFRGKTVYVPSDFTAKYERHRFLLPGAKIEGYDPQDTEALGLLLRSRHFVALERPLGETVGGPYRVFADRLALKSRLTSREIWRIVSQNDIDFFIHQEFIVRRHSLRREEGDVSGIPPPGRFPVLPGDGKSKRGKPD